MNLNGVEKAISRRLERFPTVKQYVSDAYYKTNYLIHGDLDFTSEIHPGAELITPSTWTGIDQDHRKEFFGYYDKTPWSPNSNRAVFHNITSKEEVNIVIYDKKCSKRDVIGKSRAWNYQQGAMTQWLSNDKVIFNDIKDGKLVSKVISVEEDESQMFPFPIQTVHPDTSSLLSINYRRLDRFRPQYGYSKPVSNFSADLSIAEDGIWHVDIGTGQFELLVTIREVLEHSPRFEVNESGHWLNHVFYTPDGTGCIFMHRWRNEGDRLSQLIYYDIELDRLNILLDDGKVSHYCWVDNSTLLVWGKHSSAKKQYYMIDITGNTVEQVHKDGGINEYGDGHPSYSDVNESFVTDTYPGRDRVQTLLLFKLDSDSVITLGRFHAPLEYSDSFSCDLHPRWSPCGRYVSFDSAHTGTRKTYMIRVDDVVENMEHSCGSVQIS